MASCPKCGAAVDGSSVTCPGCWVILAKARPRPGAAAPAPQAPRAWHTIPEAPEEKSALGAGLRIAAALVLGGGAWMAFSRFDFGKTAPLDVPVARMSEGPAPPPLPKLGPVDPEDGPPFTREEGQFLNALGQRLNSQPESVASPQEIATLQALFARRPTNRNLKAFLGNVLFRSADEALKRNADDETDRAIERLKEFDAREPKVYEFETIARARRGDWPGTETAARTHATLGGPPTLGVSVALALALERQNRRDEAATVLARPEIQACGRETPGPDAPACAAAARLRQSLSAATATVAGGPTQSAVDPGDGRIREAAQIDADKDQIQSDRFDVRFDGPQNGLARDVLFVLDRAYSRLSNVYFDRPHRKIPVVLHSQQDYYLKTGAPWWSGGVFRPHDGTIQIPIRGLPATLPKDMEDVLVHELSHAFVDEMSGGLAGRELQEGLAQYMEGRRIDTEMTLPELRALANARNETVMTFYMLSLVISEQLVTSRGQSAVNQLLKAMKETGSEDAGYVKTFGRPAATMKRDILETFWKRYS